MIISRSLQLVGRFGNSLMSASIDRCFFERLITYARVSCLRLIKRQLFLDSTIGPDPKIAIGPPRCEDRHAYSHAELKLPFVARSWVEAQFSLRNKLTVGFTFK